MAVGKEQLAKKTKVGSWQGAVGKKQKLAVGKEQLAKKLKLAVGKEQLAKKTKVGSWQGAVGKNFANIIVSFFLSSLQSPV